MDLFTNVLAFRMDKSSLVVWSVFALTMLFLRHLLLDIDLMIACILRYVDKKPKLDVHIDSDGDGESKNEGDAVARIPKKSFV